jgi:uncharacterized protein YcbX
VRLSEIWIHPVKSLAGGRAVHARVDDRGLEGDRRFMVVDASDRFLTQREHPPMARVAARIEGGSLRLETAGRAALALPIEVEGPAREVTVWDDRCRAIDAGDEAAGWLSDALEREVRLVRMPESTRRPVARAYSSEGALVSFADAFPLLLIGQGSLDALNARLEQPVDARRFRPNLVIAGAPPFAEDGWSELTVGALRLRVTKPCSRCTIVNVDPDGGTRGTEPLATLATFRTKDRQIFFGQNLVHAGEGELSVGDPVIAVSGREE